MIAKLKWTQRNAQQNKEQLQNPTMAVTIRINNNRTTALEQTAAKAAGGGGLICIYWYQIFALYFAALESQKILGAHGGFLTIPMYHHKKQNNQTNAL